MRSALSFAPDLTRDAALLRQFAACPQAFQRCADPVLDEFRAAALAPLLAQVRQDRPSSHGNDALMAEIMSVSVAAERVQAAKSAGAGHEKLLLAAVAELPGSRLGGPKQLFLRAYTEFQVASFVAAALNLSKTTKFTHWTHTSGRHSTTNLASSRPACSPKQPLRRIPKHSFQAQLRRTAQRPAAQPGVTALLPRHHRRCAARLRW